MASIIPNHRRGTWQIQWHDGQRRRRKTVTRKPAGWKPGAKLPRKPPAAVNEALALYQRKEEAAARDRPADPGETVRQFLDAYRARYAASKAAGSAVQFGYAADKFAAWCEGAKVTLAAAVTPDVVDRFVQARSAAGASFNTVKKETSLLAGAWSRAVKKRRLAENPWKALEIPGKAPPPRDSSWSREEYDRLCAACRPWLRALVVLACHTGLRLKALARLEWRDVRWNTGAGAGFGMIVVRPELDKTGKGYKIPMSRRCHDFLAPLDPGSRRKGVFVLAGQRGKPIKSLQSVQDAVIRACARAGLARPDAPVHSMRRTFGRWAVLGHLTGKPIPMYVVSKWLGHASTRTTEIYLNIREDESMDWMQEAEGFNGEPPSTPPPATGPTP